MGTRYADESRNEVLFVSGETTGSRVEREGLLDDGAFTLRVSDSIDGALKILEEHTIDCIVSDDRVSDGDGIAFLERVRVQYPTLPFILVTGTQDDERVSRAVSANVTEYLPRDSLTDMDRSLVSLTEQAIATHERRRELTDFELGATSVLEAARDPMFVLDAEEILYANENARDLFGIEAPARSPSVAPTSLFVGNSLPVSLSDIRETDSAFVSRPRVGIRVYGDETTVRLGASGIEWKGREAMVYILQDLSVTRTRISMVNRFFKAVQNSGHAIYITDSDGTIEYVNPAFEAITGYRAAEARGANPRILQSGEMSDGYYRDLYDCITSGEVWEEDITNRRKSGETYLAHQTIAPIRSADGTVEAYVGIQSEVTEQENARQTLVRYEQAINSSSDLLAAVDTDYDYLFANSRYRDLYGIADDVDITTLTLQEVLAAETFETVEPHIKKALSGETSETETDRVDPDGTVHTYSVRLFPLRDADEAIQGVGASLTDITERQHRREKLKRLSTYRETLHDASRVFLKEQPRTSTMSEVARTISRQDVFGCVTIVLLDDDSIEYTCSASEHVDLETVEEFHTDAYVDSVLDAGTLYMDDVTGAPYHHHPEQMRSHGGVALAIEHETEQYGILTV
ncbi:MAG: PAS domain S-box protein, partial [Halanaeroarchaeum sp.]